MPDVDITAGPAASGSANEGLPPAHFGSSWDGPTNWAATVNPSLLSPRLAAAFASARHTPAVASAGWAAAGTDSDAHTAAELSLDAGDPPVTVGGLVCAGLLATAGGGILLAAGVPCGAAASVAIAGAACERLEGVAKRAGRAWARCGRCACRWVMGAEAHAHYQHCMTVYIEEQPGEGMRW